MSGPRSPFLSLPKLTLAWCWDWVITGLIFFIFLLLSCIDWMVDLVRDPRDEDSLD